MDWLQIIKDVATIFAASAGGIVVRRVGLSGSSRTVALLLT